MPINSLRRERGLAGFLWKYLWGPINLIAGFLPMLCLNALQFPSLLLLPFSRRAFRRYNQGIAYLIWGWWVWGSRHIVGLRIHVVGDDLPMRENAIVLANHQGMSDILVILSLAFDKGCISYANWMAKDQLKYIPGLGWGLLFFETIFLKRNWSDDVANIRATFSRIMKDKVPIWLVLFPEGTRFKSEKLQKNNEYAAATGKKRTNYVLLPRTKGMTSSMVGLEGHVDAVYSLTIGYPGKVPKLPQLMRGDIDNVYIHVARYAFQDLPTDEKARADWLKKEFYKKDALLETFHKTGRFT